MATLHSPIQISPSTTQSTLQRRLTASSTASAGTGTAPVKLRDSCHLCASSKVKCHKEKPTCSRCAKRGLKCEYFVTKRAGRKHDPNRASLSHQNDTSNNPSIVQSVNNVAQQTLPPASSGWSSAGITAPALSVTAAAAVTSTSSISSPAIAFAPQQNPVSPQLTATTSSSEGLFTGLLSPAEHPFSNAFSGFGNEMDDFFGDGMGFEMNGGDGADGTKNMENGGDIMCKFLFANILVPFRLKPRTGSCSFLGSPFPSR